MLYHRHIDIAFHPVAFCSRQWGNRPYVLDRALNKKASSTIFQVFGMTLPGIEPIPSRTAGEYSTTRPLDAFSSPCIFHYVDDYQWYTCILCIFDAIHIFLPILNTARVLKCMHIKRTLVIWCLIPEMRMRIVKVTYVRWPYLQELRIHIRTASCHRIWTSPTWSRVLLRLRTASCYWLQAVIRTKCKH